MIGRYDQPRGLTMDQPQRPTDASPPDDFARQAELGNPGLLSEFWDLLVHNKKWWLIPTVVVLLLIGILVLLGSSAAAPFIYTLF